MYAYFRFSLTLLSQIGLRMLLLYSVKGGDWLT